MRAIQRFLKLLKLPAKLAGFATPDGRSSAPIRCHEDCHARSWYSRARSAIAPVEFCVVFPLFEDASSVEETRELNRRASVDRASAPRVRPGPAARRL